MKNKYIVVAYYTKNTGYEEEVQNLIRSLEAFNLPQDVQGINDLGGWIANTNYKPVFCKAMLDKHKKPIVYIDADARIQQYPALFDKISVDFACHLRKSHEGLELLSGTLYINCTAPALRLVELWNDNVLYNPEVWEQKNLQKALYSQIFITKDLRFINLPVTYCQIFDLMKDEGKPVIEHFQASRRFKNPRK